MSEFTQIISIVGDLGGIGTMLVVIWLQARLIQEQRRVHDERFDRLMTVLIRLCGKVPAGED